MHKNYKNKIISGNTIRFAGGYNKKTNKNFVIINDNKIKINKLNNSQKSSIKNYKNNYDDEYDDDYNDYE
jgi:hypothetical protein